MGNCKLLWVAGLYQDVDITPSYQPEMMDAMPGELAVPPKLNHAFSDSASLQGLLNLTEN